MLDNCAGVRPRGQSLFIRRHRGFSLVEVMMSIVLLAIGMAIALPSFTDQVGKRQVTNGAEQLAAFVNSAQGTAMKMNRVVSVSWTFTDSNNWCIGATDNEAPCDCTVENWGSDGFCKIAGESYRLNDSMANERGLVHGVTGDGAYGFDPVRGLLTDLGDSLTMDIRSRNGDYRLKLVVNNVGRVTLCSSDAEHAVPGYKPCPAFGGIEIIPEPI